MLKGAYGGRAARICKQGKITLSASPYSYLRRNGRSVRPDRRDVWNRSMIIIRSFGPAVISHLLNMDTADRKHVSSDRAYPSVMEFCGDWRSSGLPSARPREPVNR